MCSFCLVVERREEHIFRSNLECVTMIGVKLHRVALFFLGIKKRLPDSCLVGFVWVFFLLGIADTLMWAMGK